MELHYRAAQSRTPNGKVILRQYLKYADAEACATALYHYETAGYEEGQQAVLWNPWEKIIPKAQWLLKHGRQRQNPTYGFWRAEGLLKSYVLQVYDARAHGSPSAIAEEVPPDINYLMAKALHRQQRKDKYDEAALHYRAAIKKIDLLPEAGEEAAPLLISLLCDMTEGLPVAHPYPSGGRV